MKGVARRMALGQECVLGLTALLGLLGCGDEESATANVDAIRLAVNNWRASAVNVEIARQLLVDEMGLEVELIDADPNEQFGQIAQGEIHACLEVWGSSRRDQIETYVDSGLVEDGGELGVIGKIGWFVPGYMLERFPQLETWEGLMDPQVIDALSTPETGDLGRFLGAVAGYSTRDQQIIANLELNLQVVTPESEEEALQQLVGAYDNEEPFIMYWWLPHSIHARYDLHNVILPGYSDDCYAKADEGGVDCDYPTDRLFKIFWPGLQGAAPAAHSFLTAMTLSTRDQIDLLGAVEYEDKTIEQASEDWIEANESTWRSWIP